jgi:hypothetical protein
LQAAQKGAGWDDGQPEMAGGREVVDVQGNQRIGPAAIDRQTIFV